MAARGVLELVDEADLTPAPRCAINAPIERGPGTISVQTGGARCAASLIGDMIRDPANVIRRQRILCPVSWHYDRRMSQLRREDLAPAVRWSDLIDEFDRWSDAGRVATLWWRDDDAAGPSERLDRLLSISGDIPIALASFPPAGADSRLAACLHTPLVAPNSASFVLQHGWRTRATRSMQKSESPERSRRAVRTIWLRADAVGDAFRSSLSFGSGAPWNRFYCRSCRSCPIAASLEYRVWARGDRFARHRRRCGHVHVDLVAWTGDRGFIGEGAALRGLIGHLRARRSKGVDAGEPTGILTHHLVQDEATDTFLRKLAAITGGHRAARWLDATEVFARGVCSLP